MTQQPYSTELTDPVERRRVLTELAADCFAAARFVPSEAEIGEQYLAAVADKDSPRAECSPRQRKPRLPVPGGLLTAAQAAARLGCSVKTLNGYVKASALKYVALGHGKKRPRRMFTDADLDDFITNQTRKDAPPCPSTKTRVRRSGNLTSGGEVIAFTAVQRPRPGGKRKR